MGYLALVHAVLSVVTLGFAARLFDQIFVSLSPLEFNAREMSFHDSPSAQELSIGRCLATDSVAIAILAPIMGLLSASFSLERADDFGKSPGKL